MRKTIAEGDRFIDPDTRKIYVVTALVLDGSHVTLKEADGDHQILMSREELKTWESPGETR